MTYNYWEYLKLKIVKYSINKFYYLLTQKVESEEEEI